MRIESCSDQRSEDLQTYYGRAAEGEGDWLPAAAGAMLQLIDHLRSLPDQRVVWGLTSHYRLVFLAEDTYKSPWYVIVSATVFSIMVEYLMPKEIAPWPGAYVRGEAHSLGEAVQMVLVSMDLSGGWKAYPGG